MDVRDAAHAFAAALVRGRPGERYLLGGPNWTTKEFFARVIQHETDHLHGRVYLDRMRDFSTLTHLAEWNKYWLGIQEQDD